MTDLTSIAEWMEQNGFHLWKGYQLDCNMLNQTVLWVYGPVVPDEDIVRLDKLALSPWAWYPTREDRTARAITEFLTDEGVRFSVDLAGAGDRVMKYLTLDDPKEEPSALVN